MINRDERGCFVKGHSLGVRFGNGQKSMHILKGEEKKDIYEKISMAQKGKRRSYLIGNKYSLGRIPWNKGLKGICKANSGSKTREQMLGSNNINWKGGITLINRAIRTSMEYEQWRTKVFERDLYTCQFCSEVGGTLEADHIKPFAFYPELRFELDNGRTLCHECHKTTETYKRKAHRTATYDGFVIGQNI